MPWNLKYEKNDNLVSIDFITKNELDEYIKSNNLDNEWKVIDQIKAVVPTEKE